MATIREVVEKLAEAVDEMHIDRCCEYCTIEGWQETEQAIALALVEADRLDAERDALRAEVEDLKMEVRQYDRALMDENADARALRAEVERLKAELARYTGPLTNDQWGAVYDQLMIGHDHITRIDEAIREVRTNAVPE